MQDERKIDQILNVNDSLQSATIETKANFMKPVIDLKTLIQSDLTLSQVFCVFFLVSYLFAKIDVPQERF